MNNNMDRRGFLKAMLVIAGSVVAPGLISAEPRSAVYAPSMKPVPLPVYGKAIPYSKEARILSQFDPDDPIQVALRKQMRVSVSRYWPYDMARIATPGVRIRGALT